MSTQSGAGALGRSFYDLRKGARERKVSDALDGTLAQSDWIPLTLLRKLDHAPRDELCCWIGAVHEPQLPEGFLKSARQHLNVFWPEMLLVFQKLLDRHSRHPNVLTLSWKLGTCNLDCIAPAVERRHAHRGSG